MLVLLRFLMQLSRVDYYNPICQAIVKVTDAPVKPLKKILPAFRGVDFATLLVALIVQLLAVSIVMFLSGSYAFHPIYIAWSLVGLLSAIFKIYYFNNSWNFFTYVIKLQCEYIGCGAWKDINICIYIISR